MLKQLYSYQLKVLVGVRWDRRDFLELNLYVYGGDNNRIIVYNMGEWPEREKKEIFRIILWTFVIKIKN